MIAKYHDSPAARHHGVRRTVTLLKRAFDFASKWMKRKVQEYVRACDVCQRCMADHHLPRGHTQVLDFPVRKWESISMDFMKTTENSMGLCFGISR